MNIINIAVAIGALIIGAGVGVGWSSYQSTPTTVVCPAVSQQEDPAAWQRMTRATHAPLHGQQGF
jgi:hypothetical protein